MAVKSDALFQFYLPGVHAEDGLAAGQVGQFHGDAAVEAAGAQKRGIERIRAVGGREYDHALVGVEAIHLGQKLVERLFALVVAADHAAVALFADGVDLVDEDDAGRFLRRLLEQIAHLGRAHAHEHLHKLRAGNGEERHVRLAGHGLGQQRLARAWRADQQRALGQFRADLGIALRVVEEIDDLGQRLLGLVLAGDVVKGDARLFLADDFGVGLAKAHGVLAAHALCRLHTSTGNPRRR